MANHHKPVVLAAHECAAHWEGRTPKDTVACLRNWLRRVDALAVVEPLDGEGRPAAAPVAAGNNVHPLRSRQSKPRMANAGNLDRFNDSEW